ncbi:MAG: hypothetical protein CM15mP74_27520 [Halieaceae bacterium]|nr:MAG: hypothetical protein CM15mP74_27520 [Halieaceae bacterium]
MSSDLITHLETDAVRGSLIFWLIEPRDAINPDTMVERVVFDLICYPGASAYLNALESAVAFSGWLYW